VTERSGRATSALLERAGRPASDADRRSLAEALALASDES
jgi:hypothetical protein